MKSLLTPSINFPRTRMLGRALLTLVIIAFFTGTGAQAEEAFLHKSVRVILTFEEEAAVALDSASRTKLLAELDDVRNQNWCPFGSISISAYPALKQEKARGEQSLGIRRTQYIHELLFRSGVPRRLLNIQDLAHEGYDPDPGWGHRPRVEILFLGTLSKTDCSIPATAGGFRSLSDAD